MRLRSLKTRRAGYLSVLLVGAGVDDGERGELRRVEASAQDVQLVVSVDDDGARLQRDLKWGVTVWGIAPRVNRNPSIFKGRYLGQLSERVGTQAGVLDPVLRGI
jgi:hypothetical protein